MHYIEISVFALITDMSFPSCCSQNPKQVLCVQVRDTSDLFLATGKGRALGQQTQQIQPLHKR